jgi:hypothetical protein
VRKAVISEALSKARGFPARSKSVRLPFGVALLVLVLEREWGGVVVSVELPADCVDCWDKESEPIEEVTDPVSEEFEVFPASSRSVSILTPRPSLLLAGTTVIVCPSFLLKLVRRG